MRRQLPDIAAAPLCFTAALLIAGEPAALAFALPAALIVLLLFLLLKRLLATRPDGLRLKATALTLLLWLPVLGLFLPLITPRSGLSDCMIDDEFEAAAEAGPDEAADVMPYRILAPVRDTAGGAGLTVYSCDAADHYVEATNSAWAGAVDRKVLDKPRPSYPEAAREARVAGQVAVLVSVAETGRVAWAQAVSGHRLLRQPAMEAACRARFSPLLADGPPIRVHGILTYDFGR